MSDLIITFSLVCILKAIRDVDDWRFEMSIFSRSRFLRWLHRGWERWHVVDTWHLADGAIVTGLFAYCFYLKYPDREWYAYLGFTVLFWIIFYRPFNFLYHFGFMKREYRDWIQRRKF